MMYAFTVPGKPLAKARHRMGKWGSYTPKPTVNYEVFVKECFLVAYPLYQILEGPVKITIDAYIPRPKYHYNKRGLKDTAPKYSIKRADWDNYGKIISDALNGIAYRDDSQVCDGRVKKIYDDKPRVEVTIQTMEDSCL